MNKETSKAEQNKQNESDDHKTQENKQIEQNLLANELTDPPNG